MSTRIAGISMGPRNPVCLTPVSTPLSQLAGDVWKTWSWESVMGPHFEPCLLTLSPEFLIVTGDLCKVCWKINSLDYSNIIASMPFLKKLFFLAALDRLCFVRAFSTIITSLCFTSPMPQVCFLLSFYAFPQENFFFSFFLMSTIISSMWLFPPLWKPVWSRKFPPVSSP